MISMRFDGARWVRLAWLVVLTLLLVSCGGKKADKTTTPEGEKPPAAEQPGEPESAAEEQAVESAKDRIKEWLGQELGGQVKAKGAEVGKQVAAKLAADSEVHAAADKLVKAVLADPTVKKRLDKISDRATSGLGNQLTLGWKALKAGGVDAYKQQVKADTMRVAVPVLTDHLKVVLKDPRMGEVMRGFAPALKVQGKVAAMALEENLSPRVAKKILGIALRISAAGDNAGMAQRVEKWIGECSDDASREVDKLLTGVATLPAVEEAARGLAVDVLTHDRTKREVTAMVQAVVSDSEVNPQLVKVYEAAAFQHGDAKVRATLEKTLAMSAVDRELFALMDRLAAAEGAGPLINKHASVVATDAKMAELSENFIINLLEMCGDPTASE